MRKRLSHRKRARTPLVSPSARTASTERATAYERLGITPESAAAAPQVTPVLRQIPDGGLRRAIEFLRASSEPDARKFLTVYDSLPPTQRKLLPFEAFCVACGLGPKRVLELVTGACFEQSDATVALLARASQPKIVATTIRLAATAKGVKDREFLHKHTGFVPVPKTNIVSVRGNVNQDNRTQIAITELSSIDAAQARITDRFNERLMLPEPEPLELPDETVSSAEESELVR